MRSTRQETREQERNWEEIGEKVNRLITASVLSLSLRKQGGNSHISLSR
jgi:hypothetical protein